MWSGCVGINFKIFGLSIAVCTTFGLYCPAYVRAQANEVDIRGAGGQASGSSIYVDQSAGTNNTVQGTITDNSSIRAIQRGSNEKLNVQMLGGTANRVITLQGAGNGNTISVTQSGEGNNQVVVGDSLTADVAQQSGGQVGNNNNITIEQDGSDHTAWVTDQHGDNNELHLKQSTKGNYAQFSQIGDNNKIVASQEGSHDRAYVSQTGNKNTVQNLKQSADSSELTIVQHGNQNNIGDVEQTGGMNLTARIEQTAFSGENHLSFKQSGLGNVAELKQESGNNLILLRQAGEASSFRATQQNEGNRIVGHTDTDLATQTGNSLDAEILQKGSAGNTLHFEQSQTGSAKNTAKITQEDGGTATFKQKASDSHAVISQRGKNSVSLDQQGDSLSASLSQDGTGNEIELVQRAANSQFSASQTGQDNTLRWNEQGSGLGNNVRTNVMQNGTGNSIVMNASGR